MYIHVHEHARIPSSFDHKFVFGACHRPPKVDCQLPNASWQVSIMLPRSLYFEEWGVGNIMKNTFKYASRRLRMRAGMRPRMPPPSMLRMQIFLGWVGPLSDSTSADESTCRMSPFSCPCKPEFKPSAASCSSDRLSWQHMQNQDLLVSASWWLVFLPYTHTCKHSRKKDATYYHRSELA